MTISHADSNLQDDSLLCCKTVIIHKTHGGRLKSTLKMLPSSTLLQAVILFCTLWITRPIGGQEISTDKEKCPHPAVPIYSSVTLSNADIGPGTTATYNCDEGYELFGEPARACLPGGKWSGDLPHCAVNVAYRKPANQSSTVRGGDASHANDGDLTTLHENKYCTETKSEASPWWQVDLLHPYPVSVVRIVTRGCCGHQPLQDLEIRVGNSSTVQGNRLCAWYPLTLDDGVTRDFPCAYPIVGRYVYVQIVGTQGSLTMCEVMVFTTQEISSGRCGNQLEPLELTTFSRTCYEFQAQKGGSFQQAQDYCKARGGLVLHTVQDLTHNFVAAELERRKDQLKSKLVWLGAQRDTGLRAKTWHWVNNDPVKKYLWAEDQPNNYNGQQNCVVLDGGRRWLWNDVTCDLDYLPWVCQYSPSTCGSPDRQENSTIVEKDFRIGQVVTYKCPTGSKVVGDMFRTCNSVGFWTGSAPSCQHVNCGGLKDIQFGKVKLLEDRTTYNGTAKYECDTNYTLVGEMFRRCTENGSWNGTEPSCKYHWCPNISAPINGTLELSGTKAGDEGRYSCDRGHKLEGDDMRTCELGGSWTGDDPTCKFVDCGLPPRLGNGSYQLIDSGSTTYLSRIVYRCHDNYTLTGNGERTCLETGKWSGKRPECKLIECGQPSMPKGAEIAEDSSFTVHSVVEYRCKAGHKMMTTHLYADAEEKEMITRRCLPDGKWSGDPPICKYIDCGRLQPPLKGEVKYPEGSTHLGSSAAYFCSSGYRTIGPDVRICGADGKWTLSAPKCHEVRCVPPEVPKNATVVYGGNDRASADSFRVGSTVQYKCISGHLVKGEPMRTCQPDGHWSREPPTCIYIDCGLPFPVPHGHWLLPSNTTFYGSQVEYVCDVNYRLEGPPRRLCLENGTWSSNEPACEVVSCGIPPKKDDQTTIIGISFIVEHEVDYSCSKGYQLIGNETRTCLSDGEWSGSTPFCKLIDCGTPSAIPNGQGFLANGTTTYLSLVQYRCLPEFQMVGTSSRTCTDTGDWSDLEPKCVDFIPDNENSADGQYADGQEADASKTIGIAIAVGAGALLIIVIIAGVICMKTRRAKVLKSSQTNGNTGGMPSGRVGAVVDCGDKDTSTLRAYPRLAIDAETSNGSLNGNIRHNPNGLVTFGSPNQFHQQQPIYANLDDRENGSRTQPGLPRAVHQLRNGVVQSESL